MFRLIRSFDTGHGNPISAARFTSPAENNHNELRATVDRETVLGSRLYREGARDAAITPAIYYPPTVVGLHHTDCLQVLQRESAFNPTLYPPGAKCRAAHFRMRTVWQANRYDRSSRVGIRSARNSARLNSVSILLFDWRFKLRAPFRTRPCRDFRRAINFA